ncbi:hypothetical protein GCM10011344_46150 [Dokdonia pacifica]|uniref:Uncharacterized protein n=1 Tax=Dokdonia pacifica TaxID=1627892 RepID=A0A239DBL8_9FLAO|nr:hypothetical protein [Dokdonia pacifica]GGG40051.1 hypothetical protein GCM10011344_46150 [Dokdonia pacifica]SNS29710.1 hypothetical protein SAMN06265376_11087 [Dokdonia pacifica]
MKNKNLNELKLKKETISKLASDTIKGGGTSFTSCIACDAPKPGGQESFANECYWSQGQADASNADLCLGN